MEKTKQKPFYIPKLSNTFQIHNKLEFRKLQWYIITIDSMFSKNNPSFKENFIKIKNQNGREIYFIGKKIEDTKYNIVYIGDIQRVDNNNINSSNLVFFVTIEGNNNFKISNLTRRFVKLFNDTIAKLLRRNEYNLKSYTFRIHNFEYKNPFRKSLFKYFQQNMIFSSEITDDLKTKLDKNIMDFISWNSNSNVEKINPIEMYNYLNNMKDETDKNKLPVKQYIEFILLFKTLGADYYLKNRKHMFKNIPTYPKIDNKKITNDRKKYLKTESIKILTEKKIGKNIKIFFSNEILKKNQKNTHIFIDGSSISKTDSCIIIITLKNNIYKCLFFIKYKKSKEIIPKHLEKCSRKKKKKSDLCKCEWLFILNFILEKLQYLKGITIDFEPGLVSAANAKNLKIFGCYFHYLQNLYLKTQKSDTTQILASICETIPFCKKKTRDNIIKKLKKITTDTKIYEDKRIFNDNKIIKYLEKFFLSKFINKFNYDVKTTEDYFKLTNNCCERFFRYLKREAMSDKYTFEESITTRVYLDTVNFFKTKKSNLKDKYDRAGSLIHDLIGRYIEKVELGEKFLVCKKKPKKDKNFDKSKKSNISKSKNDSFINSKFHHYSESEFSDDFTNEKTTRSLKYLKKIGDKFENYSEKYKNKKFSYIKKGLESNMDLIIKVKKQGKKIKELEKMLKSKNTKEIEKNSNLESELLGYMERIKNLESTCENMENALKRLKTK